jgi:hypothetical protein
MQNLIQQYYIYSNDEKLVLRIRFFLKQKQRFHKGTDVSVQLPLLLCIRKVLGFVLGREADSPS